MDSERFCFDSSAMPQTVFPDPSIKYPDKRTAPWLTLGDKKKEEPIIHDQPKTGFKHRIFLLNTCQRRRKIHQSMMGEGGKNNIKPQCNTLPHYHSSAALYNCNPLLRKRQGPEGLLKRQEET